jgi:hypothetical protein
MLEFEDHDVSRNTDQKEGSGFQPENLVLLKTGEPDITFFPVDAPMTNSCHLQKN